MCTTCGVKIELTSALLYNQEWGVEYQKAHVYLRSASFFCLSSSSFCLCLYGERNKQHPTSAFPVLFFGNIHKSILPVQGVIIVNTETYCRLLLLQFMAHPPPQLAAVAVSLSSPLCLSPPSPSSDLAYTAFVSCSICSPPHFASSPQDNSGPVWRRERGERGRKEGEREGREEGRREEDRRRKKEKKERKEGVNLKIEKRRGMKKEHAG